MLSSYVDDFKMAGLKAYISNGWTIFAASVTYRIRAADYKCWCCIFGMPTYRQFGQAPSWHHSNHNDLRHGKISRSRAVSATAQWLEFRSHFATTLRHFWLRAIRMLRLGLLVADRSKSALGVTTRDPRLHSVVTLTRIIFLIDEKRRRRRLPGLTT